MSISFKDTLYSISGPVIKGSLIGIIVLLASGTIATLADMKQDLAEKETYILNTVNEKDSLQKQLDDTKEILDLSIEFGYDPMIVMLVKNSAQETVKPDTVAWRFIRTPEYAAYMMLSLIYAESGGDRNAIGDSGKARGLTQIWTSTAKDYILDITDEQLLDPAINIEVSFKHLEVLLEKYKGNIALALYAWNRGQGKVDKLISYGQSPENGYGKKVYEAALMHNADTSAY